LAQRDVSLLRIDMSGIGAEADMRCCLARLPEARLTPSGPRTAFEGAGA